MTRRAEALRHMDRCGAALRHKDRCGAALQGCEIAAAGLKPCATVVENALVRLSERQRDLRDGVVTVGRYEPSALQPGELLDRLPHYLRERRR